MASLIYVLSLLLFLILYTTCKMDTNNEKLLKQHQKLCEANYCKDHFVFALNCKYYCLSPNCYEKVWN